MVPFGWKKKSSLRISSMVRLRWKKITLESPGWKNTPKYLGHRWSHSGEKSPLSILGTDGPTRVEKSPPNNLDTDGPT